MDEIKIWENALKLIGFKLSENISMKNGNILIFHFEKYSDDYCDYGFGNFQYDTYHIEIWCENSNIKNIKIKLNDSFINKENFEKKYKSIFREVRIRSLSV